MTASVVMAVSPKSEGPQRDPGLLERERHNARPLLAESDVCHGDYVERRSTDVVELHSTLAERRRARLGQSVDLWVEDCLIACPPKREVWLVALTCHDVDQRPVRGAIRRFWKRVRDRCGPVRYFSWLELQQRGALHYHILLVDPPRGVFRRGLKLTRWLKWAWGQSPLDPNIERRSPQWFTRRAGAYVGGYAKKVGTKAYQQAYENLYQPLRTFQHSRLRASKAELQQHRSRPVYLFVPEYTIPGGLQPAHLLHVGDYHHEPGHNCPTAPGYRKEVRPRRARQVRTPPRRLLREQTLGHMRSWLRQ